MKKSIQFMLILLAILVLFPLAWSWITSTQEGLQVENEVTETVEIPESSSVDDANIFKQVQNLANGGSVMDLLNPIQEDNNNELNCPLLSNMIIDSPNKITQKAESVGISESKPQDINKAYANCLLK